MYISLNVFQVKQVKTIQNSESQKNDEHEHLKKKYTRVLKMYHEANKELLAHKNKNLRVNKLFSSEVKPRESSMDSLSLTPEKI